jgi:hypothetical protein
MRRRSSRWGDRRRAVAIGVVVALIGPAIAPAQAAAPVAAAGSGYVDPFRDLGAASPSCRFVLPAQQRESCRRSGSAVHRYPLSSYGFDNRVGFSITDPGRSFLGALQSLAAMLWMGIVFLLKGVLLLLEWTFALDLTGRAMPESRRTLGQLHQKVFGEPWMLAAISIAGLWGIWRGLVQRQTTQTIAGLASTVGLMVLGLLVISQPSATVGYASRLANEAGTSVLAAATTGELRNSRGALARSLSDVFHATVRDPWCALEFGSVEYCDQRTKPGSPASNADLWLRYPAQSKEREELYRLLKGEDIDGGGLIDTVTSPPLDLIGLDGDGPKLSKEVRDLVGKAPERARMQEEGGTFPRFALLGVIALGLLGAVALLGYIGLRLLLASILTVLLLLFAPAMLLAPAFGDSGRALFIAWARRLIGAIAAKLIYAVFLTVVLAASRTFTHLDIGWFGTWLLLIAFWWGVLLKRNELVGFVSYGLPRTEGRGLGGALSQAYYAWMLSRGVRGAMGSAASRPGRAVGAVRDRRAEASTARAAATADVAREHLDADASRVLTGEQRAAHDGVRRRQHLERELRATDRRLQGYDEGAAAARAQRVDPPAPTKEQQALLSYRERLRGALDDPELRGADERVRHAARNRAQLGHDVSERDLASYRAQRLQDRGLPVDHERNLRAAGVDPSEYAGADPSRREELRGAVERHLQRERDLLDAASASERPSRDQTRRAERWLPAEEVQGRAAEQRARLREERRRRRARAGVIRPR